LAKKKVPVGLIVVGGGLIAGTVVAVYVLWKITTGVSDMFKNIFGPVSNALENAKKSVSDAVGGAGAGVQNWWKYQTASPGSEIRNPELYKKTTVATLPTAIIPAKPKVGGAMGEQIAEAIAILKYMDNWLPSTGKIQGGADDQRAQMRLHLANLEAALAKIKIGVNPSEYAKVINDAAFFIQDMKKKYPKKDWPKTTLAGLRSMMGEFYGILAFVNEEIPKVQTPYQRYKLIQAASYCHQGLGMIYNSGLMGK